MTHRIDESWDPIVLLIDSVFLTTAVCIIILVLWIYLSIRLSQFAVHIVYWFRFRRNLRDFREIKRANQAVFKSTRNGDGKKQKPRMQQLIEERFPDASPLRHDLKDKLIHKYPLPVRLMNKYGKQAFLWLMTPFTYALLIWVYLLWRQARREKASDEKAFDEAVMRMRVELVPLSREKKTEKSKNPTQGSTSSIVNRIKKALSVLQTLVSTDQSDKPANGEDESQSLRGKPSQDSREKSSMV